MKNNYNNIKKYNFEENKFFLYRLNPAIKIILTVLMFKIIFSLNINFSQNNIYFYMNIFLFIFFIFVLFWLLIIIDFSLKKLFYQILNFKFLFLFSLIIHSSFQIPNLANHNDYLEIYIWKNFFNLFFIFFIFFLFFCFFVKDKIYKKIYWILNFFFFLVLPFLIHYGYIYISFFSKIYIQSIFFKKNDLFQIFLIFIRILLILIVNILINQTTSFIEINDGLEIILKPLKKIKFPVEIFSIMLSLIFMSIPFLLEETQKIFKAQLSRGLNFYTHNFFKKIYYLISLLIPIFILSFKKSFVLANAMESRGFVLGQERTKLANYKILKKDYFILIIVFLFFLISFF
ncbi:energy-coupling factor transporter transmembrane protein EcfT [Texas Phoenix palm phytoplasma]|uniref:Energy-coupling factor transporter transmembrane protein EcfT n=1 Tax=Texas Phoenix palm phytoplasma TaxID=176709 RepID=A0ABS5BJL8_9MOLU|nr:energy-coupling factor transporter transmembrane component T [Texas Phoenix palm phytoplasma]MBP3059389.1 energy-coupling factor transporter transmembrane protein EcfT [Texas Phoenix palm phytoplasma]